jgi:hypothetical protein
MVYKNPKTTPKCLRFGSHKLKNVKINQKNYLRDYEEVSVNNPDIHTGERTAIIKPFQRTPKSG